MRKRIEILAAVLLISILTTISVSASQLHDPSNPDDFAATGEDVQFFAVKDIDYLENCSVFIDREEDRQDNAAVFIAVPCDAFEQGKFMMPTQEQNMEPKSDAIQTEQAYRPFGQTISYIGLGNGTSNDIILQEALNDNADASECTVYLELETETEPQEEQDTPAMQNTGRWTARCVQKEIPSGETTIDVPDVVFRGDPVTIHLNAEDASGIDAVTLVDPHAQKRSIPLKRYGEKFIATYSTIATTTEGTYKVLGPSGNIFYFNILPNYIIAFDIEDTDIIEESQVSISGIVMLDDGSAPKEDRIIISIGDVATTLQLDGKGRFGFSFFAPEEGEYDITASIITEHKVFSNSKKLVVKPRYPFDGCVEQLNCTDWSDCISGSQERTCIDMNKCIDGTRIEARVCENRYTATNKKDKTSSDDQTPHGIGLAIGFMTSVDVSILKIFMVFLGTAMLIATLAFAGWHKGDNRKKPSANDILSGRSKIDLDSYIKQRRTRK